MKRGQSIHKSIPGNCGTFWVAALGASTSAPTVPANGSFTPTTSTYPLICNSIDKTAAGAPTRSGTGVYVITCEHQAPVWMFATGSVVAAGASPTSALTAEVTKIDSVNRQITVKTYTPSGTATDLGTNDMLILAVDYHDSSV